MMDKDKLARYKIVNDMSTNFFVEASAGSGKTTSLVNRMVALIEQGITTVDKICTITFTIAAANEFFDRFQDLLSIRCNEESEEERRKAELEVPNGGLPPTTNISRERCREALVNIDLCVMGTLDGFANRVVHEFPNEFNVPASSGIISDDEAKNFIKQTYYNLCYEKDNELVRRYNNIYGRLAFDTFSVSILRLLDNRDSKFVYNIEDFKIDLNKRFAVEKRAILEYIDDFKKINFDKQNDSSRAINKIIKSTENKIRNDWNVHFSDVCYFLNTIDKSHSFPSSVEGSLFERAYLVKDKKNFVYTDAAIKEIKKIHDRLEDYRYSIAMMLFDKSVNQVSELMKNEGKLKFFDYIYYLREKLKEDSNTQEKTLIKHIYNKHQYFLLDESQDTNPMQTEIFFYLTGRKTTSDWMETDPIPGSLFIVGDPKQSIYRFRGADVSSYLKTERLFTSGKVGECLILSRNYRSNKRLREWFNYSMNNVLDSKEEKLTHADIEIDHDPVREAKENATTLDGLYIANLNDLKEQPSYLGKLIKLLHDNDEYIIMPKKAKTPRRIKYSDFMIITPFPKGTETFIDTFHELGIPFEIEGRQLFPHSNLFLALKAMTFVSIDPHSKEYLLELYQSGLFNYNDDDFILLRNIGYTFDILSDFTSEDEKYINYIKNHDFIKKLVLLTKDMSYSSRMLYFLHNMPLVESFGADYYECVYYAINVLKDAENTLAVRDDDSCIEFLNNLLTSKDYERTMVFEKTSEDGKVKLANVHKVKGLQAPIVIIASPVSSIIPPDIHIERGTDGTTAKIFNISETADHITTTYISTSKFDKEKEYELNCNEAERKRLEYVAATRAESVLILVKSSKNIAKDKINPWQNLLNNAYEDLPSFPEGDELDKEYTPVMAKCSDLKSGNVSLKDFNEPSYEIVSPSKEATSKSYRTNDTDIPEQDVVDVHNVITDVGSDEIQNNVKGTCIHRLVELLVNSKNSYKLEDLVASIVAEFDVKEYYDDLLKVAETITSGGFPQMNGSLPNDIITLLLSADKVMCEVPFSYKEDSKIIYGTIDCIFYKDNKWTIIDYKTNNERDIIKLNEEYKGQLDLYVKAFKIISGNDSKAFIYHIDK